MSTQHTADPYATLGVARGATTSQVRAAYRRLAKQFHPDVRADARATEQMRRINLAWETLSSPARRAQYDARFASPAAAQTYGHWSGVPRRAQPAAASSPQWTAYAGSRGTYRDEETNGPIRWGAVLLLIPVTVLSLAILSAGILPFPLVGFLIFLIVSLVGRDS